MKKIYVLIILASLTSLSALARDSQELQCTGFALLDQGDSYQQFPLSVQAINSRSPDGDNRQELLSTVYQGNLFQANFLDKSSGGPVGGSISLVDKANPKSILFAGTFELVQKGQTYSLRLKGQMSQDPSSLEEPFSSPVDSLLPCQDISVIGSGIIKK